MRAAAARLAGAFTLIELLVSMTVLVLLVGTIAQMVSSASNLINRSRGDMDTDTEARLVLDRLDEDLSRIVKRPDVQYIFARQPSNRSDNLFFYSEAPAFFQGSVSTNSSSMALLGYRINSQNQLERLGRKLNWEGPAPRNKTSQDAQTGADPGAMVFLSYPLASPAPTPGPTPTPVPLATTTLQGNWPAIGTAAQQFKDGYDPCYHRLGEQVFRLEICFLLRRADGSVIFANTPALTTPPTYPTDGGINGLPDELTGLVTTVALLDPGSRQLLGSDPAKLLAVAATLLDPTDADLLNGVLPAETWQKALNAPNAAFAGNAQISTGIASKIRVYQRVVYLPTK